jgi:hypothetical protein
MLVIVVESGQHVIGLEQPDRQTVNESYVETATQRHGERGITLDYPASRVEERHVGSRHPKQGMHERLNPVAFADGKLRAD